MKSQPLLRDLGLLWRRMGAARLYVGAAAACLLILAALGVVHLFSPAAKPGNKPVGKEVLASAAISKAQPLPSASANEAVPQEPSLLAITEVTPMKRRLRDGSTSVTVRVGVTPRPDSRKGEVEIRVFFFDITRDREIRPTDAQVGYDWITPVRDWTDPAPKYLEATYLRPRTPRRAPGELRYGGFVVRVYLDGQLQDERSEPKEILAVLGGAGHPDFAPSLGAANPAPLAAAATPSSFDESPPPELNSTPTPDARVATPSSPPQKVTAASGSPAPYGSPVPNKPGFVHSPYNEKFLIDVRGFPPGTEINDPNTGKPLRVP